MSDKFFKLKVYNQDGVGFDLNFPTAAKFIQFLYKFSIGTIPYSSDSMLNHYIHTVTSEIAVTLATEVRNEEDKP